MPSNFIHLHCHSEYSLLDGAVKVEKLVKRAKELDMPAVALTDHGNMFGAVKFYRTARKEGIKPLIGMEAYVTRGSRWDKTKKKGELAQINHLILLARNTQGYQNLMRLTSLAYLEGFYYKPRIDAELLEKYCGGLVAMSACLRGDIAQTVLHEGYDDAKRKAERMRELFGRDNYFLEVMDHGIEDQKIVREQVVRLSRDTNIPLVATNDAHYLMREDAEAHEALLCLQTGSDFDDPRRFRFRTQELYFKTPQEMQRLFADIPEVLENTLQVADRCDVELDQKTFHLPKFPLPEGFESMSAYLEHVAYEGARKRFGELSDEVEQRLKYEFSVIDKMNYSGYFLIVRDIVNFARSAEIPVGPGRGSAAGSLLCYVLRITDVNPLEYGLLFERMLNPERVSMPDIDIDFCFERRDEVIRYVIDRYGKDSVCQIITFGTMAARGVVRDVGRVLKIPYSETDKIAKLIPGVPGTSLEESIRNVPDLKRLTDGDLPYQKLMKLSLTLEGITRHASIHAAGMIITPTPLINHLPLYRTNKGEVTSQYDMKSAEAVGLLKIDVLGLRTLTVIDKAVRMIEADRGVHIEPAKIPMNDQKTFELLQQGKTIGVFQLESGGMRELLKKMQPESFNDIIAVNALYRPGPLDSGMHTQFVECKHGRKQIEYIHPSLEPLLKETYGVILYQEQVMQIASALAGFSLGEADILRKAMGKKDSVVMAEQKKKFVDGAVANEIARRTAQTIFGQIEKFARYGFNKSHSAAYAVISVQTAYLKANYPVEFMAANLSSETDDTDRIVILLDDARGNSIGIVPPDINTCEAEFTVKDGKIYYGLVAVKNVGGNAVKHVIEERNTNGSFESLLNFCSRVSSRVVNRRVIESLIQAGAFDAFGSHRAELMHNLERIMETALRSSQDAERGQFGLFTEDKSFTEDRLDPCGRWSSQELLTYEKAALGFFLSGHPLDKFSNIIAVLGSLSTTGLKSSENGKQATVGGLIGQIKTTFDRKKNPMAFVTIEDREGQAEVVMFSDALEKNKQFVREDQVVLMEGKVSTRNGGEGKLLVSNVIPISEDRPPVSKELHITLDIDESEQERLSEIKHLLEGRTGDAEIFLHLQQKGKKACVVRSRSMSVTLDYDMLAALCASVGVQNISLVRGTSKMV